MLDQKKNNARSTLKKMKTSSKNNATDLDVNDIGKTGYANLSPLRLLSRKSTIQKV